MVHLPMNNVFDLLTSGSFPLNPVVQVGPPAPVPWPGPGYPTTPQLMPAPTTVAPSQPGSPKTQPAALPADQPLPGPGAEPGAIDTRAPGSPGSSAVPAAAPSPTGDPRAPDPLPSGDRDRSPAPVAPKSEPVPVAPKSELSVPPTP